jgi:uncharacterized protein with NAD-binding domain and iron-sulfur cluster
MTKFDDDTLEAAAELLERSAGNTLYEAAWRAGAKKIRALKNSKESVSILKDGRAQISNSSSRPV